MINDYNNTIEKVTISEEKIKNRIKELGEEIVSDYKEKNLFVMSVLKGSVVFLADITRSISIPLEFGFVTISTYCGTTSPKVEPRISIETMPDLEGKDVLLVEDILDTGKTIRCTKSWVEKQSPKSIKVCVFVAKEGFEKCEYPNPDYIGFVIPNEFVVGYGLDYQEKFRNLPYLGILKPWVYNMEEAVGENK